MPEMEDDRVRLLQDEHKQYVAATLGAEPWVTVYDWKKNESETVAFFCALIPNNLLESVMNKQDGGWDKHLGFGKPGCTQYGDGTVEYFRYGNDDGVEPLVLWREFPGGKQSYVEVSEEFRLFHNLYYDRAANRYIRINEVGEEEEVIRFDGDSVKVRLKPLKQFLSIKEMHLAIYFEYEQFSPVSLEDVGLKESLDQVVGDKWRYDFYTGNWTFSARTDTRKSFSRLTGKKLVPGVFKERSGIWPYEETQEYEKFIIDTDSDGEPIEFTCDPDQLANFFGANPEAPNYLTPVFFDRKVLSKYLNNPSRYSINDGHIRCEGLWLLRIDNNHEKYVTVYLGDLGTDLPYKEQQYWKLHNVEPDGIISEVNFRRNFMAEWTDPTRADLVFKTTFNQVQTKWETKFGWPLFKPFRETDAHNLKILAIPLANDQHQFDQQVLALAKTIIDSLNESQIEATLDEKLANAKGIAKFEKFLEANGLTKYAAHITYLKRLWDLRIGAGHRKGDTYDRGANYFRMTERPLIEVFTDILQQAIGLLTYLNDHLLVEKTDQ